MTPFFTLARRALRRLMLPLLLLSGSCIGLVACGPGVGGTGTGAEPPPDAFGAQARSLCASSLAEVLACTGGGVAQPGLDPAVASADWAGDAARLRFRGDQAELTLVCQGQVFSGSWGAVGTGAPRFYGQLSGPSGAVPAQLDVAREEGAVPARLRLRLLDANGQPLGVPLTVTLGATLAPC